MSNCVWSHRQQPTRLPSVCDPIDSSPPGSPIPGFLQARTLEWVAISFSNAWKWKVKGNSLSRVWLCATPEMAAHQAPPSLGFSRQEHWNELPFPFPLHESEKWKWVRLLVTPWIAAHQAPPSMGSSRQEGWSRVPLPSPIYSMVLTIIRTFQRKKCTFHFHLQIWATSLELSLLCSKLLPRKQTYSLNV